MQQTRRGAIVMVIAMGGMQLASAASVSVTVVGGTVAVSPKPVVSKADKVATFSMDTADHVISSLSIAGGTTRVSCDIATGGQSATCTKVGAGAGGDLALLLVVSTTAGKTLPSPNVWIQDN